MKKYLLLPLLPAFALALSSCEKPQTDAARQAEIDRQVQQRLDAEHQADAQKNLDQRQAELDARERALRDQENQPAAPAPPNEKPQPTAAAVAVPDDEETGSYATFYRKLDPYGDWIETGSYGYVFQPRPAARSRDWRPYTNGHWVYTDAGWTWISDEPFGWATYHYGRWTRLRDVGWVWVPGNDWAPAWVSWRRGNDFVGWAPLPPQAHFNRSTGIQISSDSTYGISPEQYAFVPARDFGGPQSTRVIVPPARNVTIIKQTTNITNITVNNSIVVDRGPSYEDLRARSQQKIPRLKLERTQDVNDERPVIRGEVVAMPAPNFRPAKQGARPPRVQQNLSRDVAERPLQPNEKPQAPRPPRSTPAATATETAKPAPVVTPRPRIKPTPTPTATPTVPTTPPAAAPSATPEPSLNPRQQQRRERQKEMRQKREGRRGGKPGETPAGEATPTPDASATTTPAETSTPTETATETPTPTPVSKGRRPGPRPNRP